MKILAVLLVIIFPLTASSQGKGKNNRRGTTPALYTQIVPITLTFAANPTTCVLTKAPLKYDKDMGYSHTLDDGYLSSLQNAYPVLNGGVDTNGTTWPQLYYTDGCGNNIPFKAGLAYYSISSTTGANLHNGDLTHLTIANVLTLYNAGWDVICHSLDHANISTSPFTTWGFSGLGIPNYSYEVTQGMSQMASDLGITVQPLFIIPAGDLGYYTPAVNAGCNAIFNQAGSQFNGILPDIGVRVDNVFMNRRPFALYRVIRSSGSDQNDTYPALTANLDAVAAKAVNGQKWWYNEFTHQVWNGKTGASLTLTIFGQFMTYIYNTYGGGGTDRIWVAGLQTIYDYIRFREDAYLSTPVISGNTATFNISHPYNNNSILRRAQLTIKITSDQNVSSVTVPSGWTYSFRGTGSNKILNIEKSL